MCRETTRPRRMGGADSRRLGHSPQDPSRVRADRLGKSRGATGPLLEEPTSLGAALAQRCGEPSYHSPPAPDGQSSGRAVEGRAGTPALMKSAEAANERADVRMRPRSGAHSGGRTDATDTKRRSSRRRRHAQGARRRTRNPVCTPPARSEGWRGAGAGIRDAARYRRGRRGGRGAHARARRCAPRPRGARRRG